MVTSKGVMADSTFRAVKARALNAAGFSHRVSKYESDHNVNPDKRALASQRGVSDRKSVV